MRSADRPADGTNKGDRRFVSGFKLPKTNRAFERLVALQTPCFHQIKEPYMTLSTIILIVLVLLLIGALPSWPHAQNWGYGPSGLLGTVVIILLILMLMGRI